MKLTIAKSALLRAVGHCVGVADTKGRMPILANVLLEASDVLRVSATDLYLSATDSVTDVQIKEPGAIALPAKQLFDRVKMLPDGPVEIAAKPKAEPGKSEAGQWTATIRSTTTPRKYSMGFVAGDEFPSMPKPDDGAEWLEIQAGKLLRLLDRTHYAICADETRPALNSLFVEWTGTILRTAATDGHRLAVATMPFESSRPGTMLLSAKAIGELRRLMGKDADDEPTTVRFAASLPNVFFETGTVRFSAKVVEGTFPPYQQVIPTDSERTAQVPRVALLDTLKAVSVVIEGRGEGARIEFSKGSMRLLGQGHGSGDGADELPAEYEGPDIAIGMNPRYLIDALGALDSEEIQLRFGGELDPVVIVPAGAEDFVGVLMPVRL